MTRHVIDPGHGPIPGRGRSSQYGVRGPRLGLDESAIAWRLAAQVQRYLGSNAILTREEGDNPSLGERAEGARTGGASSFLSLHANGAGAGSRGSEAFVHTRANPASVELAERVQHELHQLGHPGHGVMRADMAVLTPEALGQEVAACLVEVDNLMDPGGEQRLGDDRELDTLARALARAVVGMERLGRGTVARGLDEIAPPVFDPSNPVQWIIDLSAWLRQRLLFTVGISDASIFPHSSIAHLEFDWTDGNTYTGSGFYISPSRILTAGHNVIDSDGSATNMRIRAGRTRGVSVNDVTLRDTRFFHAHPSWTAPYTSRDFDMAVIEVPVGPTDGRYFSIEEQRMSPVGGMAVCGYAGAGVDSTIQHMDTGYIVDVLAETYTYNIETRRGTSGGPVFYFDDALNPIATGHNVARQRPGTPAGADADVNVGCRLTDAKIAWIWTHGFSVYFDYEQAVLRSDNSTTATLAQIVAFFGANPGKRIDIVGHASPEGGTALNQRLSDNRAEAVAAHLRANGLGGRIRNVRGDGESFGAAHVAAQYPADRRAVVLPV